MDYPTDWSSDGTKSVPAVGSSRLPDEAMGRKHTARVFNTGNMEYGGGKIALVLQLKVEFEGAAYDVSHTVFDKRQFSTFATLAGLPAGAKPASLVGCKFTVECRLNKKGYVALSKVEAHTPSVPEPVVEPVPF